MTRAEMKLNIKYWQNMLLMVGYLTINPSFGWTNHGLITFLALNQSQLISKEPTIPAESLNLFIEKEQQGLIKMLADNETWSRNNLEGYAPLPDVLKFLPNNNSKLSLQTQFAQALRINPEVPLPLYVQYLIGQPHRIQHTPLGKKNVMLSSIADSAWITILNPPLELINENEMVSPIEIITTASDEPDFGLDTNLYEDNPDNVWGDLYQWGKQPFGNPNFSLGSQAPFHMGFFYEPTLFYWLSFIERTHVEYRIHLYITLSQFAFKTGHPYWGYRFLGWATHYLQDLTQPYHTTTSPNYWATRMITSSLLNSLWITSPLKNLTQLITNRHFVLENYAVNSLKDAILNNTNSPIFNLLTDESHDNNYPAYSDGYPRYVVAKESNALADSVDQIIRDNFPYRYVNEPEYVFYETEPEPPNMFLLVSKRPSEELTRLNKELGTLFSAMGAHTRSLIHYIQK